MYFVIEFKLIDSKELAPLQHLIDSMMGADKTKGAHAASSAASSQPQPPQTPTAAESPLEAEEVVHG
jgi:hypothetical protein